MASEMAWEEVSKLVRAAFASERTVTIHAPKINEIMTAYSTAVGPSSERTNRATDFQMVLRIEVITSKLTDGRSCKGLPDSPTSTNTR